MSDNNYSSGIGLPGLLTVLFVALKLTGYISWSWWWVVSPIWISFSLVLFIAIVVIFVFLIVDNK